MNLIIVEEKDYINETRVKISGRRFKHIKRLHRSRKDKTLRVGKLNGKMGEGKIIQLGKKEAVLDLILDRKPPKPTDIKLVMALPRPKVFQRVLQTITTMGIKEIYFIRTWKVEKSFFESSKLSKKNIKRNILLGLEQARDTIEPNVKIKKLFKPFVEDELPNIIKGTLPLVAHPYSDKKEICNLDQPKTICIGPEGGFTPYEVNKLKNIGFHALSIGNRILKVESVVPYIVGKFK